MRAMQTRRRGSRSPTRRDVMHAAAVAACCVALAACAPAARHAAPAAASVSDPATGTGRATIVAVRVVPAAAAPAALAPAPAADSAPAGGGLAAIDWRSSALAALVPGSPGLPAPGGTATATAEYIVRAEDGRTLSVVQAESAGLRPGEAVAILFSDRTRIAPLP